MGGHSRLTVRTIIATMAGIMLIQAGLVFYSQRIGADDGVAKVWSWSVASPTVFEATKIDSIAGAEVCPTSYQAKDIAGEFAMKQVCMTTGVHMNFGMYFTGHGYQSVVGFSYDSKMYKAMIGVCEQALTCRYLPATDTLVTLEYLINGYVRSLVVYKNFTHRLTRTMNDLLPITEYHFDASHPDYIFQNTSGYEWPVGGFGASDDGKWLAVEFRQRGMGLLNIETLEMKRFSTIALSYGTGYNPTIEFAVSNGGRHVAIMGRNVGFYVYDIDPWCGDIVTDDNMSSDIPLQHPCKIAPIDTGDFIYRFFMGSHPRFNDDGSELRFYAAAYTYELRDVTLRAAGYVNQRIDYLALGDSFSSGEGETDDNYYINGTNDTYEKCHTSTRSYPYVIAKVLGIEGQYVKSVACSGAVTADIVGGNTDYLGQGGRLANENLNLGDTRIIVNQSAAKELFIPGRIHQIDFVKQYQPKVITVGIGGNDAGFMDKLRACVGLDTCSWASSTVAREKTALEVKGLFDSFVNTYTAIHEASPQSRIYAVGYPKIINETSQCNVLFEKLLDTSERKFMNEGIVYINKVIAAAAKKVGIAYLDIENSYGGHVLCSTTESSAVNGIRTGDDSGLSESTEWLKVLGQESFHPLPTGHTLAAEAILKAIPNLLTYEYCSNGSVICPSDVTAPSPSNYWLADGTTHGYASQRVAQFTKDQDGATNQRQKTITLASYSLTPNSTVKAEIQSNPVSLGSFVADAMGGMTVNIELPKDLAEGFHTIHLYGVSFSSEQLDLYEVIQYVLPVVIKSPDVQKGKAPVIRTDVTSEPFKVKNTIQQLVPTSLSDGSVLGATDTREGNAVGAFAVNQPTENINETASSPLARSDTQNSNNYYGLIGVGLLVIVGIGYLGYGLLRH